MGFLEDNVMMVRVAGTSQLKLTYKAFTNWLWNQVRLTRSQFRCYLSGGTWKITASCFQVVGTEASHGLQTYRLSSYCRPCQLHGFNRANEVT